MSEKETKKPEVTQEVKSEGGDMKIKSKPKKFTAKSEIIKIPTNKNKKASAGTEKIWNNIYKKITVTKEA